MGISQEAGGAWAGPRSGESRPVSGTSHSSGGVGIRVEGARGRERPAGSEPAGSCGIRTECMLALPHVNLTGVNG